MLCFVLAEAVTALNQVLQPTCGAGCRNDIDHIVIKTDRHTEIFPVGDMLVKDPWFLANTAHRNSKCWGGWRYAPTAPFR